MLGHAIMWSVEIPYAILGVLIIFMIEGTLLYLVLKSASLKMGEGSIYFPLP